MLDIRYIRDNVDLVQTNAKNKGYDVDIKKLIDLDDLRRKKLSVVEDLREKRNINSQSASPSPSSSISPSPSPSVSSNSQYVPKNTNEGKKLKEDLRAAESDLKNTEVEYMKLLKKVPNMATNDVPIGASEDENVVSKTVGNVPEFEFTPRNHADIASERDWIDKERAAKVAGSRFAYIKGDLVKLQFAIIQFVIDVLTDEQKLSEISKKADLDISARPFVPILPPLMIRTDMYDAMDRLEPQDDRYKLEGDDLWLQGSAEHVLGSMHASETFDESMLPLRYLGYATSFRREAGTYGKDMEGILRIHQFDKLEMESFTTSDDGLKEHLFFVAIQEYLLSHLGLPYRVIAKCTADIGKPNASGIDMETWLPGQGKYRETHTADYMTDYQSRRLNTRVRRQSGAAELVHTNDATAFALGRIMIAIIENNQTADGKVNIPFVLQSYMGGRTVL